jgi:Tol biopolymer transport system component
LTIAASAGLALLGGFLVWRFVVAAQVSRKDETARSVRSLTYGAGLKQQPSWSPDGQFLAYAAEDEESSDIWVQSVSNPTPVRLTQSEGQEWQPAWSPDGRTIAYRSESEGGGLYTVPATGGPPQRITTFGFLPQWSPSGKTILFSSSGPDAPGSILYIVGVDGTPPRPVTHQSLRDLKVIHAAWFPTGDRISVIGRKARGRWEFVTFPAAEAGPAVTSTIAPEVAKGLQGSGVALRAFAWSRTGRQLFFSGGSQGVANLWRISVDPITLAWVGGPDRLTTGAGDDVEPSVSPDGTQLAFAVRSARTRVWSFPFDTKAGKLTGSGLPLTPGGPGEYDAAVPPDGSRLAYRISRGGRQELWETSVPDKRGRLLLAGPWAQTSPRWSHDGTLLAYQRMGRDRARGDSAIRILAPDTGVERSLAAPAFNDLVPDDWSADGAWILASCQRDSNSRRETCLVAAAPSAAPEVRVIASDPGRDLICQRFSPDGRWISFMASDMRNAQVSTLYVMPAAGGAWTPLTTGTSYDDKPRWSPDGRAVYFVSNRGGLLDVWGRRFDPANGRPIGEPFRVSNFSDPKRLVARDLGRVEIAVAADQLFLPITESSSQIWLLDNVSR